MEWDYGEPEPGEGFCLVIQAVQQENWDWLEMGEGGMYTLLQRQQGTQHGKDDRGHGGPNRMTSLSEKVSGSQTRGLKFRFS